MPEFEDISEIASSYHENGPSDHEEEMDLESFDDSKLPPRARNPPSFLDDYVTGREAEEEEQLNSLALFSTLYDPNAFEEASKLKVWREAMKQEIDSIESNNTWELATLPAGCKKIGYKWI